MKTNEAKNEQPNETSNEPSKKPVKQFRAGAVGVSIFRREHNGELYYNATPSRAYTRDDGRSWEYSDSFSRDELPIVAKLLEMAFSWIVSQTAK